MHYATLTSHRYVFTWKWCLPPSQALKISFGSFGYLYFLPSAVQVLYRYCIGILELWGKCISPRIICCYLMSICFHLSILRVTNNFLTGKKNYMMCNYTGVFAKILPNLLSNAEILALIVKVFRKTQILERWHRKVVVCSGFTIHTVCAELRHGAWQQFSALEVVFWLRHKIEIIALCYPYELFVVSVSDLELDCSG